MAEVAFYREWLRDHKAISDLEEVKKILSDKGLHLDEENPITEGDNRYPIPNYWIYVVGSDSKDVPTLGQLEWNGTHNMWEVIGFNRGQLDLAAAYSLQDHFVVWNWTDDM